MPSFILEFVDFNETMDYGVIIPLIFIYLLIFWLIVSGWVAYDAYKRYGSKLRAAGIFFLNLIFGVPFLILYLLMRPIDEEYESDPIATVPMVNFVGKEGEVVMTMELHINSKKVDVAQAAEMKVDVKFGGNKEEQKELEKDITVENVTKEEKMEAVEKIESAPETTTVTKKPNLFQRLMSKIKSGAFEPMRHEAKHEPVTLDTSEIKTEASIENSSPVQTAVQRPDGQSSKKNKKKHKKKK